MLFQAFKADIPS